MSFARDTQSNREQNMRTLGTRNARTPLIEVIRMLDLPARGPAGHLVNVVRSNMVSHARLMWKRGHTNTEILFVTSQLRHRQLDR